MLLRPRWVVGHVLIVALTIAFVTAGFWQLARNREVRDEDAAVRAALARPAPDVANVDLVAGATTSRRVSATGVYDAANQSLLRSRSRNDTPGYDVLTPLRLDNGDAVLVDRGWVEVGVVATGTATGGVPAGTVTVRGRLLRATALRAGEEVTEEGDLPALPRVDVEWVADRAGYDLLPVYLEAQHQEPPPGDDAPALPELESSASVNHLSYALQWFSFAAIAVIGWPLVLRRVTRSKRRARATSGSRGSGTAVRPGETGPSAGVDRESVSSRRRP
jgi:cytochrome oxidase assembly protein ShyY1